MDEEWTHHGTSEFYNDHIIYMCICILHVSLLNDWVNPGETGRLKLVINEFVQHCVSRATTVLKGFKPAGCCRQDSFMVSTHTNVTVTCST